MTDVKYVTGTEIKDRLNAFNQEDYLVVATDNRSPMNATLGEIKGSYIISLEARIKELEDDLVTWEACSPVNYLGVYKRDEKVRKLGISLAEYINLGLDDND